MLKLAIGLQLKKDPSHIKLQCIQLVINQPVQKLVGVIAATVETISLQ